MERWSVEQDRTQAAESVKMETTAGVRQQSGFICSAADNFQHTPKSSRARIDKRTARAARNTRYRYNEIGPLDHQMADRQLCFLGPHKYSFLGPHKYSFLNNN